MVIWRLPASPSSAAVPGKRQATRRDGAVLPAYSRAERRATRSVIARKPALNGLSRFGDSLLYAGLPTSHLGRPLGLKNPPELRSAVSAGSRDLRRTHAEITDWQRH